jgi:predicted enzyme related to lactoylglutathione lyase
MLSGEVCDSRFVNSKETIMSATLPDNAVVWFEIPVSDFAAAQTFYNTVFKTELMVNEDGPNPIAVFPCKNPASGVGGHLYEGKAADAGKGITVHLAAPDSVEETMDRVVQQRGKVVSDVIAIPAGRFVYCLDPDGNSFGVFK